MDVQSTVGATATVSRCSWLSCCDGRLKGRVCPQWRMLPGIITLVAFVALACVVIIWKKHYLWIAIAPGVLASIYLIYLGWSFKSLQTLQESNLQLQESIEHFKNQNLQLENKLQAFEKQNQILTKSTQELRELSQSLQNENENLKESNLELKKNIIGLKEIENTLQEKAGKHVKSLEGLHQSLSGLDVSAKANHETFGQNLLVLKEEIQNLKSVSNLFNENGSNLEKKMAEQLKTLLKATDHLETIFSKIAEWKNDRYVEQLLNLNQQYSKEVENLKMESTALKVNIEIQKELLEEQKKILLQQENEVTKLQELKKGHSENLQKLLQRIQQIKDVKEELAKEVKILQATLQEIYNKQSNK